MGVNIPNELDPRLVGVHGLNFAMSHNSGPRSVMFSSHFSQHLVIHGAEEKRIQTGVELEFSKYTFAVRMPVDGRILRVIDRYPQRVDADYIPNNHTLVIYEDINTREIGCFEIPYHASYHQYFGYKYTHTSAMSKLMPGTVIPKGTVFANTPAVEENGTYKYGTNLNVAFMSIPGISEDGVVVSEDVLDKLTFDVYDTRVVEFGSNEFPLNLYGDEKTYKPFPEIGETIREDGLLMMLRKYDPEAAPVMMSIYDVMEPDFIFDNGVYVRGAGGRIVDIKVYQNGNTSGVLPSKIMDHMGKYPRALISYYEEVIKAEHGIRAERRKKYNSSDVALSPAFQRLLVEARAAVGDNIKKHSQPLSLLYRKAPLDEYRIVFTIEYKLRPTIGFKLTGSHGDKGVVCKIEKPENMPVDSAGNRADIIMDPISTISRMNLGRLYESYYNSVIRDVTTAIRAMLGIGKCSAEAAADQITMLAPDTVTRAYNYLMGFYSIISPPQFDYFNNLSQDLKVQHLADVVADGVYLYYPIDNQVEDIEVITKLEQHYRPTYGPVSYVGNSGKRTVTEQPVRISPTYIMLLEKIADDWSAVSSARLQHFGVLSTLTRSAKFQFPCRYSPVRSVGETEGRIYVGYCGRLATAEMIDRSNNPATHHSLVASILKADKPGDIQCAVDRSVHKFGNAKPLQLINHIAMCGGWQMAYVPESH